MAGERYVSIFISEDPSEVNPELASVGWLWIKASTGQIFNWNGSAWEDTGLAMFNGTIASATIIALEVQGEAEFQDIVEFKGDIEVPGGEGVDAEFETGGFNYKFSKGVLVEREAT